MGKIIIENRSNLTDEHAVRLVSSVIRTGRISNNNKQYCFITKWINDGFDYFVAAGLNKKSDRFIVYQEKSNN